MATPRYRWSALRPRVSFRFRFNPQVLVLVSTLVLASPAIVGIVVSGIHVFWSATFRQVDYTMHEARPNDGYPYVTGTHGVTGEEFLVTARRDGETFLVGTRGDEAFVPGKVVKLWWSPRAPDVVINGQRTNGIPVAAMPQRPGLLALAGYLAWLVAVLVVGLRVANWAMRYRRNEIVQPR